MCSTSAPIATLLRDWRVRRRLSQLDLALEANVSARHVSFLETGRSKPSREMLIRLAERLDVPLRDRNVLLTAAGYAPIYPERSLDDPELKAARMAVDRVLTGHEPFPAFAVDRAWTLVAANRAVSVMLELVNPELVVPPVNVLRLALHPDGLAPAIANLAQVRLQILSRLNKLVARTGDPELSALLEELRSYSVPAGTASRRPAESASSDVLVPLQLRTDAGQLNFISTVTIFGSPMDVTLAELAVEAFFPADQFTADILFQRLNLNSGN